MSFRALREEFPVLEHKAYLNAGTDGPLPLAAVKAATEELQRELADGRAQAHFERRSELSGQLRELYSAALGCEQADLALTSCTSEGVALVVDGLSLTAGDEILTSDEEHPGLLGPLQAAREIRGVSIRIAPLQELPEAVGARTKLIACSHVSWMTGSLAPSGLAELDVPVLLDGAQGVGAVAVDVGELGCQAYAGSGQKWLCGPDGMGMLYVSEDLRERLAVTRRGYSNLENPNAGLDAALHEDARRFDTLSLSAETLACALAAVRLLSGFGFAEIHERACTLAAELAAAVQREGRFLAPRSQSTLVSFSSPDAVAERARLGDQGVILRDIPGLSMLRASVGAWNDERDLQRLIDGLGQ
ncbi:MAG TPA: aminotransferase class V-fold PLP-dependent enzyme [Solirubrobacteraceae bacterium]